MVGNMSRVTLNFDLSKIAYVHFYSQGQDLYTHTKNWTCAFTSSYLRAVTDANDDDDDDDNNAGHHTYRQ